MSLTVVLCNYNYAHFIEASLKSIIDQSYTPLELLILDDASTDNSVEIIKEAIKDVPYAKLIVNSKNLGYNKNFEKALSLVKGDYVVFTSPDDRMLPGYLEKSMNTLHKYPDAKLCISNHAHHDLSKGVYAPVTTTEPFSMLSKKMEEPIYLAPPDLVKLMRSTKFWVSGVTMVVNTEILRSSGGYREELADKSDWFLLHTIGFRHGLCYIPETLVSMGVHSDSYSAAQTKEQKEE